MSSKSETGREPDFDPDRTMTNNRANKNNSSVEGLEGETEAENERTGEKGLFDQVFSIPLILIEILKSLGKEHLLITSIVNRNWNFFSRKVLRENKKCLAIVEGTEFCDNLRNLNAVLRKSETVPFNGISVSVLSDHMDMCMARRTLSKIMRNILLKINIKYLSFNCLNNSETIPLKCIRHILNNASSLEELRVQLPPYKRQTFSKLIGLKFEGHWLPNVRKLEYPFDFTMSYYNHHGFEFATKELVEASPKLKKLYGNVNVECLEFIVPLKLTKAVRVFDFKPTNSSLENCTAFAAENPKLEKLRFSTANDDEHSSGRISEWRQWSVPRRNEVGRILRQLINCSEDSLKKVACDHYDLILMTSQLNIPPFNNVRHLSLIYDDEIDSRANYSTLSKIDWAKYFPNLKEVCLIDQIVGGQSDEDADDEIYINDDFRMSDSLFVCESVTKLRWVKTDIFIIIRRIWMFKIIFPNVTEFYYDKSQLYLGDMDELWSGWTNLEAIYLSIDMSPRGRNFDSVFLGVEEEEARFLLENVKELESLEVVSTKPSIFNLRKLKKLMIRFMDDESYFEDEDDDEDEDFLSPLTYKCVFSRLPELALDIEPDDCKSMPFCGLLDSHRQELLVKCPKCEREDLGVTF